MLTSVSISVVICCYTTKRRRVLGAALEAAHGQLTPSDELIIVVDGNDELLADLSACRGPSIMLIPNEFDRGLSGARNSGLRRSSGDVVVFLDDDAVLRSGALEAVRVAFADPSVTALGGAVHADWRDGSEPRWFPPEFGWVVGCDYRGLPSDGSAIRNPIGAAMAVRRQQLNQIGGFSTALGRTGTVPTGCEETMMGIELVRRDPRARIIRRTRFAVSHHVPRDRATLSYFVSRCFHEGRSKAVLASLCGRSSSLASERSYTMRTLPSGLWRSRWRLTRMLALILGLTVTTSGYLWGSIGAGRQRGAQ
ncbi:glycosyltransferase family 2 protein [Mycobacterium sp. SMC-4]|uniref:glycosyltransferase n=1 Tax=Mycobacterium sp. SMC-4 TaxID=2857059 RepID=UPI0021B3CCC8|nr:glycosyltransferase family 2 protein [Mycobacterium sp. SMC-4]UXA20213.1 glycosyltransferase [Mycobacterium sp. SMC-4]